MHEWCGFTGETVSATFGGHTRTTRLCTTMLTNALDFQHPVSYWCSVQRVASPRRRVQANAAAA